MATQRQLLLSFLSVGSLLLGAAPARAGGTVLTLDDAYVLARKNNHDLKAAHARIDHSAIFGSLAALRESQPLTALTGAAHAAAWADASGAIACLREDVGRHNALDKLIGAMARTNRPLIPGFILSTARCSFEIVEKAVRAGASTLVTISLPTTLAVERAMAAGLSLWCLARDDSVLLVNDAAGPRP